MQSLLRGEMDRPTYLSLLTNLEAIYVALEDALLRHAAHPLLCPVFESGLFRSGALKADIIALHGDQATPTELQPATRSYVARLRELEEAQPELLLAHGYVRYLGDLSGGQLLKSIVKASLATEGSTGTSFFDFGDIEETTRLARRFRSALASLPLSPKAAGAVIEEAKRSFERHAAMFEEISASRNRPPTAFAGDAP